MFCRIYTSFNNADRQTILNSIALIIKGDLGLQQSIEKKGYFIEIRRNDEFNIQQAKKFPDGFLFFPHSIEIDIDDAVNLKHVITDVNDILTFLWENQYAGVTACDFEDQLIKNGGYKRNDVPWI